MKRMMMFFLLLFVCCFFTSAYSRDIKQSSVDKSMRVEGDITSVDTRHFIFTLKDNSGTETKFFASPVKINTIKKGERVSVVYRQTTDGNLKALAIKPAKEKKARRRKNS